MLPGDMGLHLCWHAICLRVHWECKKWHCLWRSDLCQGMNYPPVVFPSIYLDIHMVVLHVFEGVHWSIHYAELTWVHPSPNMRKHIWDVAFNIIHNICDVPRDVYRIIHKFSSACRRHYVRQQLPLSSIWHLMFEVFIWITMVSTWCLCECTHNFLGHSARHVCCQGAMCGQRPWRPLKCEPWRHMTLAVHNACLH